MQDQSKVIEQLSAIEGLSEVSHVTHFSAYVGTDEVDIKVFDRGFADPYRYTVFASTVDAEPRRTATGNGADDLDTAIATTHWGQLTKK
ncbi:hypothetical protein [Arthrobacter sp. SO3]|uniref:hypothetical protein n=1 Tax=Arthrobacter sp. SO3 TaxID=1897057 RepID=UPI001CFFE796|nr:hypothetical protein [Arthrobacter sp. SO3]MCB5291510.1 hypothetical protein [Arthrobacter sp. SO3]